MAAALSALSALERPLSPPERALVEGMFGHAIALGAVRVRTRKWWPFQPRSIVMAPRGHIHFHPESTSYCACFGAGPPAAQGLFIHEMTHVWQHQKGLNLLLRRHPFCRYDYAFEPGKPFARYGIEQQAEIVRHVFLMRRGQSVPGKPPLPVLEAILPFGP
jgi:hypothetical protein